MLKKLLIIAAGAGVLMANVNAVVSILPQKTFLEKIGGDRVHVSFMVKPGSSPHSYEPKPSQMRDVAKADVYFSIGVEFEEAWLDRFSDQNPKMEIVATDKGIEKLEMAAHHHHEEEGEEHDHNEHDEGLWEKFTDLFLSNQEDEHHEHHGKDPHVWTSPSNVKIIAKNMYDYLVIKDGGNKAYYTKKYEAFLAEVDTTSREIKKILKNKSGSKFMVFHPSWGYFAHEYGIIQLPIEVEGKNPKPKVLAYIIEEAREEGVKAVFTQPEFSDKSAKAIAKELGVEVVKTSPLSPKWSENLIKLAKAIAEK